MSTENVDTGTKQLLCEVIESIAVITLNRPSARNALSRELTRSLRRIIKDMGDRKDIKVIFLTGASGTFCAGGDVKLMRKGIGGERMTHEERVSDLQARQHALAGALRTVRKPTIAALSGPAIGAGLAISLICDIRVASESVYVSTGYSRVGLSGDYGISWTLTNLVGTAKARELMFTADRVEAEECLKLGLVNYVWPDDEFPDKAFAFAQKIASGPFVALGLIKDNLNDAQTIDFDLSLDREAERLLVSSQTKDHREAITAFVEKRNPRFSGK